MEHGGSTPPPSINIMEKYKIVKLDSPIFKPGRRIFKHKIIRLFPQGKENVGATVFLFEDLKTAEQTLEKLK